MTITDLRRVVVSLKCHDCERNLEFDGHIRVVLGENGLTKAFCCCEGCAFESDEEDDESDDV